MSSLGIPCSGPQLQAHKLRMQVGEATALEEIEVAKDILGMTVYMNMGRHGVREVCLGQDDLHTRIDRHIPRIYRCKQCVDAGGKSPCWAWPRR